MANIPAGFTRVGDLLVHQSISRAVFDDETMEVIQCFDNPVSQEGVSAITIDATRLRLAIEKIRQTARGGVIDTFRRTV